MGESSTFQLRNLNKWRRESNHEDLERGLSVDQPSTSGQLPKAKLSQRQRDKQPERSNSRNNQGTNNRYNGTAVMNPARIDALRGEQSFNATRAGTSIGSASSIGPPPKRYPSQSTTGEAEQNVQYPPNSPTSNPQPNSGELNTDSNVMTVAGPSGQQGPNSAEIYGQITPPDGTDIDSIEYFRDGHQGPIDNQESTNGNTCTLCGHAQIEGKDEEDNNDDSVPEEHQDPHPAPLWWRWWYSIPIAGVVYIPVIIGLAVVVAKNGNGNNPTPIELKVTTFQPSKAVPALGSGLSVAEVNLGSLFTRNATEEPDIKAVYDTGDGRLCVRTRSKSVWLESIRCIQGARPRKLTPLSMNDWLFGPSFGYINEDGYLSSINYVPKNDTWILSSLSEEKIKPLGGDSKLTSTTWRKGLANWYNWQDSSFQLRETGMDDMRDLRWRDSTGGQLGRAVEGSSFGVARWLIGDAEFEEIFFQATNGAIQGRSFLDQVWNKQEFSVQGTGLGVPLKTTITATAVVSKNGTSTILLAYIAADGYVKVQTRATANVTNPGAFSAPRNVVQSDGRFDSGLSADGSGGIPRIYLFKSQKLWVMESDEEMKNWTTTEVSF